MDRAQVHGTINQLVEAREDQRGLQTVLSEFRQTRVPPSAPNEFETLQQFLDYHEEKQGQEDELRDLESRLDEANAAYETAEAALKQILPPNSQVNYEYEGDREDLVGMRFKISNRHLTGGKSTLLVSSSGPETEESPQNSPEVGR
jgi:hypothetical protein